MGLNGVTHSSLNFCLAQITCSSGL
jgi:hypothetical protein